MVLRDLPLKKKRKEDTVKFKQLKDLRAGSVMFGGEGREGTSPGVPQGSVGNINITKVAKECP